MAIMKDCVQMTCDRCGYSKYYTSLVFADGIGWKMKTKLRPEDECIDLCPDCGEKWDDLVHRFLYEETV